MVIVATAATKTTQSPDDLRLREVSLAHAIESHGVTNNPTLAGNGDARTQEVVSAASAYFAFLQGEEKEKVTP